MAKMSRQKFKYLENKKLLRGNKKTVLKKLSVVKNCLRPKSVPLSTNTHEEILLVCLETITVARLMQVEQRCI